MLRVFAVTTIEALRTLHEQGRIRSPWLAGMLFRTSLLDTVRRVDAGWSWGSGAWSPPELTFDGELDLEDHATVGCLLALLREASKCPTLAPWADDPDDPGHWECPSEDDSPELHLARTEGEAIAAALIALAGGAS